MEAALKGSVQSPRDQTFHSGCVWPGALTGAPHIQGYPTGTGETAVSLLTTKGDFSKSRYALHGGQKTELFVGAKPAAACHVRFSTELKLS